MTGDGREEHGVKTVGGSSVKTTVYMMFEASVIVSQL